MSNAVDHDIDKIVMTGDVHDHLYAGSRLVLLPDQTGRSLTGISPNNIAGDGREIVIVCGGSFAGGDPAVTVKNDDSNSASGNRILSADGSDIVLSPRGTPGGTTMVWCIRNEDEEAGEIGWIEQV